MKYVDPYQNIFGSIGYLEHRPTILVNIITGAFIEAVEDDL